jgi:antitoxin component YwqK of YwqJK toxin-antitoxin module
MVLILLILEGLLHPMLPVNAATGGSEIVSEKAVDVSAEAIKQKVLRIKSKLIRPTIDKELSLEKRSGLSQIEADILKAKLTPNAYIKAAAAASAFWTSPLLTSITAIGRSKLSNASDDAAQSDEWFSEVVESDLGELFESAGPSKYPSIHLVSLSEAGFSRIQSSEEMTPTSGRDLLASIPVADFCERSPGNSVPHDFSVRFSPWDFASRLAASSRLEVLLLELILNPDALDFSGARDDDEDSDDEDSHSDDVIDLMDAGGWDAILPQFESQIKDGTLTIAKLATKIRRDQSVEQKIRRLVLSTAVSAPTFKKICDANGGKWSELTWTKEHWLDFFSCRSTAGLDVGPMFSVEDGDFDKGRLRFSMVSGSVRISASGGGDRVGLTTALLLNDKPVGIDSWFLSDGSVTAIRQRNASSPTAFVFGPQGQVEWSQTVATSSNLKNSSWYSNGAPKSVLIDSEDGVTQAMVGYHPNGMPKYWIPLRSGRPDGKFLWWHPSGKIAGELEYASGKRFGLGRLFYENGSEGFRADYSDDAPHGRLIWRDPTSRPLFSMGYTGGKANGLLEIRYGGRQIAEAHFEAGVVEGVVVLRNSRGIGVAEIPYKGGLLNGMVVLRDAAGTARLKSQWLDGQADGDTESSYSSGVPASLCKFKKGQLEEWKSFAPGSKIRYFGKINPIDNGLGDIDFYGGKDSPVLKCVVKDWAIEACAATDGANGKRNLPTLKDLVDKIEDAGDLKFKPEKCGGAMRSLDVSPFVDQATGKVEISYRTKELCQADDLATGMQCEVNYANRQWIISSCVLSEDDSEQEED